METTDLMSKKPTSKYTGLGTTIAAELMTGFWFGIGIILAVGVPWIRGFKTKTQAPQI